MRAILFVLFLSMLLPQATPAGEWVRSGINTNQPVWGVRGGLLWAIEPGGFRAQSEPRGLIRLGYPILSNGNYDLVNFIAIEPIVKGQKAFSELEHSRLDNRQGKRLWGSETQKEGSTNLWPGKLSTLSNGVEQLEVKVHVEPFDNGANVYLLISQRSDTPDEITLTIHSETNSAAMDYCILTATMGNMARTRELWLNDEMTNSLHLYPDYKGSNFTLHTIYPLDRLWRTASGDVLVAVTTDEDEPHTVFPFPGTFRWHYGGYKVTQFWKKPQGAFRKDLHTAVNARFTYWKRVQPIPGGISFENFELRERFYEGQQFVFGITRKTPAELGFKKSVSSP
ncbi:MAG: hypothetical protein H0X66_20890 [Verrucomicrobia bacterium]|nr:hypothetical protein [Verrucomicrobiota bacterium]